MYLDLLKRSLLNEVYLDDELRILYLRDCLHGKDEYDREVLHDIRTRRPDRYVESKAAREVGRFVDRDIHNSGFNRTMMGRARLDSLHECLDLIVEDDIRGDLMECGVWRGGGCIFMAGYLKDHGIADRSVIVADSFDGVPRSTHEKDVGVDLDKERFPELAVSMEEVQANFDSYGLLDETVQFVPGWFGESLGATPSEQLALLRVDGDLYESTMDVLTALYDRVSPGGIVIIDDWGVLPPCRQAVEDFFAHREEPVPTMNEIDWSGVWFRKPGAPPALARTFKSGFPSRFLADYHAGTMRHTHRDPRCIKSPIDLATYTRAIWELRPKTIIEIGTKEGGGALWFADTARGLELETHVYSIDLEPPTDIDVDQITFVRGNILDLERVLSESGIADAPHPWLVSEDSAHTREACLVALDVLQRHMQPGDLLAMEDGVLVEIGLSDRYDGGPNRAIREYLAANPGVFEIRADLCDAFGPNATHAPNGYLVRL